jgi:hypothetical protein
MFGLGATANDGKMIPVRKFVIYEKRFCGMDVWELNPEGMRSLWLNASVTSRMRAFMIGGGRSCPLFKYTLAFALQLRKCTENLSQVSRLELDISRCADSIPLNPPALYRVIKSFHTILKNVVREIIRKR